MSENQSEAGQLALFVKDEPLIRLHEIDVVERAGFETVDAGDADEALHLLSTNDVGILITDIDMLGSMDGYALAVAVHDRWP